MAQPLKTPAKNGLIFCSNFVVSGLHFHCFAANKLILFCLLLHCKQDSETFTGSKDCVIFQQHFRKSQVLFRVSLVYFLKFSFPEFYIIKEILQSYVRISLSFLLYEETLQNFLMCIYNALNDNK